MILNEEKLNELIKEINKVYRKNGIESKELQKAQESYTGLYKEIYKELLYLISIYNIKSYADLKKHLNPTDERELQRLIDENDEKGTNRTVEGLLLLFLSITIKSHEKRRVDSVREHLTNTIYKVQNNLKEKQFINTELTAEEISEAINSSWGDGYSFKENIKSNHTMLKAGLTAIILNSIKNNTISKVSGVEAYNSTLKLSGVEAYGSTLKLSGVEACKENIIKEINKYLNQEASTIRTETSRAVNSIMLKQTPYEVYQKNIDGDKTYILVTELLDTKTCSHCEEKNGDLVPEEEARVGENVPPFHVNCRGLCIKVKKAVSKIHNSKKAVSKIHNSKANRAPRITNNVVPQR